MAQKVLDIQNVMVPQNRPRKMSKDEHKLVQKIANNIKELRIAKGLTQFDMSNYGFNYRHYQRVESGKFAPTIETLLRISKVFKVKVKDLLD